MTDRSGSAADARRYRDEHDLAGDQHAARPRAPTCRTTRTSCGATPTRSPAMTSIIVGGGGHGLATAHYLAKNHGITNVAVLEKGWLAGGNMARNTTIIRSNYLWDESAGIYEHSLKLWEGLEEELGYPILFSQRGVLNLAHTLQDVRDSMRRVGANQLNGVDAEWVDAAGVKELCPIVNVSDDIRYPVLGRDLPAAGRDRQARLRGLGVRPQRRLRRDRPAAEHPGHRVPHRGQPGHRGPDHQRRHPRRGRRPRGRRQHLTADRRARHPAAAAEPPAAGAGLGAARAGAPHRGDEQRRPRLRLAGPQGRAGDGGRRRHLQRLRAARLVPHHRAPDGGGGRAVPRLRPGPRAAHLGRRRRHHAGRLARSSA